MDGGKSPVPRRALWSYAVGSIGTGGFSTLPGLVLLYYLTDTLGVAALAAGILVAVAKVWDVLIDPIIGGWSDRDLARHGNRGRLMIVGAATLPFFFALTFAVTPSASPFIAGTWVLVSFVLAATAFSLFQVPYMALPAELTDQYNQRTRLLTWRVVALTFAILMFGGGGPLLRTVSDDPFVGYLVMGVVAGVAIGLGLLVTAIVTPKFTLRGRRNEKEAKEEDAKPAGSKWTALSKHYRLGVLSLRRSRPFRVLLGTFMLQALATGMMLASAQYVATWVLHSEDAVTLLFVALIAPALVFTPVWGRMATRLGKERTFAIASAVFTVAAFSIVGLAWMPGTWVYVSVALAGAAYAGMQSMPMAMLPDVIHHDANVNGSGMGGTFSGVWTAGETTGMALGSTLLTIVLAVTGYVEASGGQQAGAQSDAATIGIIATFSVLPAILALASIVTLRGYTLRKAEVEQEGLDHL